MSLAEVEGPEVRGWDTRAPPSHALETSYSSYLAGGLVETSVFHHNNNRVVFTVKDRGFQKHAEKRRSSKVLQAHFSACGPWFFLTIMNVYLSQALW